MASAQRSAAANASPAGTTSLTKPSSSPSRALTWRAVRIMPIARFSPIWRGNRCQPAGERGEADMRLLAAPNLAFSEGDDQVAGQRDLESATHGDAVDRGDDRLVAIKPRSEAPEPALSQPRLPPAACHFRSLPAQKRLVAGAGDDRDPLLRIGAKIVETLLSSKCASVCNAFVNLGRTASRS